MIDKLSADDRRQIIDQVVENDTSLHGDERDPIPELAPDPALLEFFEARARMLRAKLDAMSDSDLLSEGMRGKEAISTLLATYNDAVKRAEEEEQRQEAERLRAYHRTLGQRGRQMATLRKAAEQRDLDDACRHMRANGIKTHIALKRLNGRRGHTMPDGRVIKFKKLTSPRSFERRWARAGKNLPQ